MGVGVTGSSNDADGVVGTTTGSTSSGVHGIKNSPAATSSLQGEVKAAGVWGECADGPGVVGVSDSGIGVSAQSKSNIGIFATSESGIAIYAKNTSSSNHTISAEGGVIAISGMSVKGGGLLGISSSGTGVIAECTSGAAISATSGSGLGIVAKSNSSDGVWGESDTDHGVVGKSNVKGSGVVGLNNSADDAAVQALNQAGGIGILARGNPAGHFDGNVEVNGALSTTGPLTVQGLDVLALPQRIQQLEQQVADLAKLVASHPQGGGTPQPTSHKPQIGVSKKDGKFVVTGSGFATGQPVGIHVVDNFLKQLVFQQSADSDGKLDFEQAISCAGGAVLHFSATDGTLANGVLVWSNTFDIMC